MTHDELGEQLERAERWFTQLPHADEQIVQTLVEEGFLSYNEITYIDAEEMVKFLPQLSEDQANEMIDYAEEYADHMERMVKEEQAANAAAAEEEARAYAAQQAEILASGGTPDEAIETTPALSDADALRNFLENGGEAPPEAESVLTSEEVSADNAGDEVEASEELTSIEEAEAAPIAEEEPLSPVLEAQKTGAPVGMPTDVEGVIEDYDHQAQQAGEGTEMSPDAPDAGDTSGRDGMTAVNRLSLACLATVALIHPTPEQGVRG